MARLTVRMLGKFSAYCDHQPVTGLEARKLQEFLAYLLLHRDHTLNREALAEVISPEAPPLHSRKTLRQTLWQLQTVLNDNAAAGGERLIIADTDSVTVNGNAGVWLDVAEVETAFAGAVGRPGETLDEDAAGTLARAVSLYRGDLLEGWYQDWCLLERERVQSCYLALLDKLMGYHRAQGEYERAVVYGRDILRYDRARERTHVCLMQIHWLAGDRTAALRQYRACAEALREELDAEPGRQTVALYQRILHDDPPARPHYPRAAGPSAAARPTHADSLLGQVKARFTDLAQLHDQVALNLAELQRLLDSQV